ncbi:uncharacterized protein LOC126318647 [Schistocerca gregaria]|uniref:uncharacterized protein LOC126318647 n=1 Tax=Schistocerca gregaria TaxID=7010 RepID=UPI00211E702C|nr:uncharacterized protein LOC126318647 [Schistocerca gregaria]
MLYKLEHHSRTNQLISLSSRFQAKLSRLERGLYAQYTSSIKTALVNLERRYEEQLSAFMKQEREYSINRLDSLEQFLQKASYHRSRHIHSVSKRTDALVSTVRKYELLIQDYQALCNLYKLFTMLQQQRQNHPSLPFDCHWEQVKESGQTIPYLKNLMISVADEMDPASKVGIESPEMLLREFKATSNRAKYAIRAQNTLDALLDAGRRVAIYLKTFWYPNAEKLEIQQSALAHRMERVALLDLEQTLVNERYVSENKKLEIGIKLVELLKSKDKMFYKNWLEKAKNAVEIECIMQLLLDELNNYTETLGFEIERQKQLMEQLSKNSSSD